MRFDDDAARRLKGPILVLGASGFVGANLMKRLTSVRDDVYGTAQRLPAWRLEGVPRERIVVADLLSPQSIPGLLDATAPKTVFNCLAFGAYPFETDAQRIYATNLTLAVRLVEALETRSIAAFVNCGSSSEYGLNGDAPREDAFLDPNSYYAASKCAAAHLIRYAGNVRRLPCAHLRLYSVYGPEEDASRLMPALMRASVDGAFPPFVSPDVCRDFVYCDDVTAALVAAADQMSPRIFGEAFNIGSGRTTTMRELATVAKSVFRLAGDPAFGSMQGRHWDTRRWSCDPAKAAAELGWRATTSLEDGLVRMRGWYEALRDRRVYEQVSKARRPDRKSSISAIIACYKDAQAVPIMCERLVATFTSLDLDYEIIFVNDGSPDDCEDVIKRLSAANRRVIGISHARNFGSQAAFRSGMQISTRAACVLLDGDLQDPPELIADFVAKWREGYDVVYGRRVHREAPFFMNVFYKLFYRVFNKMSYVSVPRDAGDFSLIDRQVVDWLLRFPERDLFLRGLRAFVGFKQAGVDYVRPERMFGRTTNSFLRNVGWAKKGILSFSNVPLNALTGISFMLVLLALLFACVQTLIRIIWPELTPNGLTTVILAVIGIGSLNLLGISIVGEYISKIFEEVKRRPHYIRKGVIRDGELLTHGVEP
jgi:dolichol-phosphate mannosyltransferase